MLQWTQPSAELLTLLEYAKFRILHAAPAVIEQDTYNFIYAVHLRTLSRFALGRLLGYIPPLFQALESITASGTSWSLVLSPLL